MCHAIELPRALIPFLSHADQNIFISMSAIAVSLQNRLGALVCACAAERTRTLNKLQFHHQGLIAETC